MYYLTSKMSRVAPKFRKLIQVPRVSLCLRLCTTLTLFFKSAGLSSPTVGFEKIFLITADLYTKFGLDIYVPKKETLRSMKNTPIHLPTDFTIQPAQIQILTFFRYLGFSVLDKYRLDTEINSRTFQSTFAFNRFGSLNFTNNRLTLSTKVKVYSVVCVPTLLYWSEVWSMYVPHVECLNASELKSLSSNLEVSRGERLTNEYLLFQH